MQRSSPVCSFIFMKVGLALIRDYRLVRIQQNRQNRLKCGQCRRPMTSNKTMLHDTRFDHAVLIRPNYFYIHGTCTSPRKALWTPSSNPLSSNHAITSSTDFFSNSSIASTMISVFGQFTEETQNVTSCTRNFASLNKFRHARLINI